MLARIWKRVLLIVLIIACVFNIMFKFIGRVPFWEQIKNALIYVGTSIIE